MDDERLGNVPDEELLAQLAGVLRPQLTPPPEVVDAAKDSFGWRTLDADLAALTADTLLDATPGGARAVEAPRMLTFEVAAVVIELEVVVTPPGRRIVGQVDPPAEVDVAVQVDRPGLPTEVTASGRTDGLGRFVMALPTERVLVSLRCSFPDGSIVQTARLWL